MRIDRQGFRADYVIVGVGGEYGELAVEGEFKDDLGLILPVFG